MKYAIVIPARYNSTRFPGKPLIDIKGKTMIQRVYEKCLLSVNSELIYVATDDKRIELHCKENDIKCIMTSESCLTGTDRIGEVVQKIDADFFINVQGDEPFVQRAPLEKLLDVFKGESGKSVQVASLMQVLKEQAFIQDPNYVKVVVDRNNNALLF